MSNTIKEIFSIILNKIEILSGFQGQTSSSMITLVIPPKYCI